jgi:hypothetical protein
MLSYLSKKIKMMLSQLGIFVFGAQWKSRRCLFKSIWCDSDLAETLTQVLDARPMDTD